MTWRSAALLVLLAAPASLAWRQAAPPVSRPHGVSAFPAAAAARPVRLAPVRMTAQATKPTTNGQRLYTSPELPKILGGLRIGTRKLGVITGSSSGLGLACLKSLLKDGKHFVVCAVRDPEKMRRVAKEEGLDTSAIAILKLELGNLQSVRDFVQNLRAFKLTRPLDFLICNAAVYLPTDPRPRFTDDGIEQSVGINHVGHYLLARLLIDDMKKADDARCVIVGSITGNTNTIGGGLVYPRADLGSLSGFKRMASGEKNVAMMDGASFFGAKAYKDSKVANMMTMYELHKRYHDSTGISFASMYPGCIAETALFREKRTWFRKLFPLFMKYVTGGYVGEDEAGERLAQCVTDPVCRKSGVYWSWNGNAQQLGIKLDAKGRPVGAGGSGGEIFENKVSDEVKDPVKSQMIWDLTAEIVGLPP